MLPKQEMELDAEDTVKVLKALETIEDLDDVQNVYSNLKVSDEAIAALGSCLGVLPQSATPALADGAGRSREF